MNIKLFQPLLGMLFCMAFSIATINSKSSPSSGIKHPALIPAPASIQWTNRDFDISRPFSVMIDPAFASFRSQVIELFKDPKKVSPSDHKNAAHVIKLVYKKMKIAYLHEQSYEINVNEHQIEIAAESGAGIFYALQTLRQLISTNYSVAGCIIKDQPSFAWRGLMHDVGRNYQSIESLKKQIQIMAAYKMNIFHFHLTEDIAWRLEIPSFPQLTAASNMKRNPGKFYTLAEVKDLIQFCKDRYITLIPEIDMPGHSDAFKRAMGVDMQSEKGLEICKQIMHEVCTQLDVPYIHIGGDEVSIKNPDFMPQMAALILAEHKKLVAWDPGAKMPAQTVLQMWNGKTVGKKGYPSLDSRHLYVNHFDPIDAVVSTFNHRVCDVAQGDSENLGAITCVWPDRRVSKEEDILNMNPVYPEILTLAERCWKGGGWKNFQSDIDQPGTERYQAFIEFESRLLEHKKRYLQQLPFPYVKQSDIHWKLIGPYNNYGNTNAVFDPETKAIDAGMITAATSVYGGTIYLRHFWAPMIGSHLKNTQENSTYYAFTRIYSKTERDLGCWIGFYNISRSTNTPAPQKGKWDNRNSCIFINGKKIEPPLWQHAGIIHKDQETPLVDESYEFRPPTSIHLNKGWNTILIKAPVASFKSNDWQTPVKWMFTAIPVVSNGVNCDRPEDLIFDPNGTAIEH